MRCEVITDKSLMHSMYHLLQQKCLQRAFQVHRRSQGMQGVQVHPRGRRRKIFLGIFVGMRQKWGWIWWGASPQKVVGGRKKVIRFLVKKKVHPLQKILATPLFKRNKLPCYRVVLWDSWACVEACISTSVCLVSCSHTTVQRGRLSVVLRPQC